MEDVKVDIVSNRKGALCTPKTSGKLGKVSVDEFVDRE